MNFFKTTAVAATLALSFGAAQAATMDTIDASSGQAGTFFVPNLGQELDSPYYRGNGQDWGWKHNAIAAGFTSVELNVSAYDVDEPFEVDEIYAMDDGVLTLIGSLVGDDNAFSFTSFTLGANFFNDVEAGLEVFMRIDTNRDGWFVSLSKSVLTTDGAGPGNPNPGVVPLPAAGWMLLAGIAGLGAVKRRKKA